jgi:hypothetical protein
MNAQAATRRRRIVIDGTGFLLIISIATIVTTALITGFIAVGTWALLPLMMLVLIFMALVVVAAAVRLAGDGEIASVELPEPESETQRAPAPVGRVAVLGG